MRRMSGKIRHALILGLALEGRKECEGKEEKLSSS